MRPVVWWIVFASKGRKGLPANVASSWLRCARAMLAVTLSGNVFYDRMDCAGLRSARPWSNLLANSERANRRWR